MEHAASSPALSVALALMAGMLAQVLARRLSIPGIVVLLASGVLLGPELLGLVQPASLGGALPMLVSFSVAVILFEGALSLDVRRLRKEGRVIRWLVTVGALVTALCGALAARGVMGWSWRNSLLFGTLVMVTGPTVITPLLRRIRVVRPVETVLEGEGIFVDAVGAITAVVALEVALRPPEEALTTFFQALALRWGVGLGVGSLAGWIIASGLKSERAIPEELRNVFSLAMVLGLGQVSGALAPESGVVAVIAAGLVVGNAGVPVRRELVTFKEQLTVMLVGMLFVLLAADVRLGEVTALGWRGLATVGLLMVVARPLAVWASTQGSKLSWRERGFIAWLGPRGIVAAAVASLFATRLESHGLEGGPALRALVFLVIAVTVVVQGLSGGWVAGLLGVRRSAPGGYVLLGANGLARLVARALKAADQNVTLVDTGAEACRRAQEEGFQVIFGDGLDERTLLRAQLEGRAGFVGLTVNEGVNLLFTNKVREHDRAALRLVAMHSGHTAIRKEHASTHNRILFGDERGLDLWASWSERGQVSLERWLLEAPQVDSSNPGESRALEETLLPVLLVRDGQVRLYDDTVRPMAGDRVDFALHAERADEARAWLTAHGWRPESTLAQTPPEEPPPGAWEKDILPASCGSSPSLS
ncbi:cation:proton antiporter [Melittangium boletus]|uniref:Sodium/hydrogen exchanger n=1 Tax=Melittangium boletus DSM 14713 TaxID=1294270 RepID=A0A286NUT7_9BACT|nr:sodium:proton antiporter [Melittangium boletus]ATB26764.1 sodium/hydrogen exchanger [Melittangium boletus DSM 14713]